MNIETVEFHKNEKNKPEILMKYANITVFCLKWITRTFLACYVSSIAFGPLICIYTNSLVLTFGFQLPFINLDSLHGFIVNLMFQNSCVYCAYKGFTALIRIYFSLFIQACTEIDIIIDSLSEFSKFIKSNFEFNQNFPKEAAEHLVTILKIHKKNNLFIQKIETIFNKVIFVTVLSTVFGVVITLVAIQSRKDFIPGYVIGIALTINLLLGFTFGTILQIKSEQLTDAIYDLTWYLLPCSEQKKIVLFLMASQNPIIITCGKFCVANLSTFLQVTLYLSVYS